MGSPLPVVPVAIPDITVELLDNTLNSQGPIQYASLGATLYHNAAGAWSLAAPFTDDLWALTKLPDFGIHVNWNDVFSFGGKCENIGFSDSVPGSSTGTGNGPVITLSGTDYKALIANRMAFPAPASAWSAQTGGGSDAQSAVPCETAIKHYVNANAGPGALTARRAPLLTIATNLARGGNVSYTVKFSSGVDFNLIDIIRNLVNTGGPMGVSVELVPGVTPGLVFDVYVPRDLTGIAYFSKFLGNLTSVDLQVGDPTDTVAYVRGASSFVQADASGETTWNRIETYVDQSSSSTAAEIAQAGTDALAQGVASPALSVTAQDIPRLMFGTDYGLGDKVTVEIAPGDTYADIISQVDFTVDPTSAVPVSVIPTIGVPADPGNADTSAISRLNAKIRRIERRLTSIQ